MDGELGFDETLAFLADHLGATVEIALSPGGDAATVASFSGQLDHLFPSSSHRGRDLWTLRLRHDGTRPSPGELRLDRARFRRASVSAEAPPAEERHSTGTLWVLDIDTDGGLVIGILFYV